MSFPNLDRQTKKLEDRVSKLLLLKRNFKSLALGLTSVDDLRHNATNYDVVRKEDVLKQYVDELHDYKYAMEYLQTFVKCIVNSMIADKLISLNKKNLADYQTKYSEQSYKCEGQSSEIAHLEIVRKDLTQKIDALNVEIEANKADLNRHEIEISRLLEENKELKSNVSSLKLKVKEQDTKIEDLKADVAIKGDTIQNLQTEVTEQYDLIGEQGEEINALKSDGVAKDERINVLETDVDKLISALKAETNERVEAMEKNNVQWRAELQETNRQWQVKYDNMVNHFNEQIAEVRGRLDNLEAQMKALHTDTEAFKVKVSELATPLSIETKQEVVRDLANLVALSYSTVANLQLADPQYEQRRTWFVLLKEVFKLAKTTLARQFGLNVKTHLDFMQLMFKSNPC